MNNDLRIILGDYESLVQSHTIEIYKKEVIYYTSDEFSDRILDKSGKIKHVSWEDLNTKYNSTEFEPIDGRLVRICDHFSALMEADISIKHGITSEHLTGGREGILSRYSNGEIISGINVNEFFQNIVSE